MRTILKTHGVKVKGENVQNLETLQTTDETYWKLHESYLEYREAFYLVDFFKRQGYAAVKIKQETENIFTIHVLLGKGE